MNPRIALSRSRAALALALTVLLVACGKGAPTVKHYDEGAAGFQAFADDLLRAGKAGDRATLGALARAATLPDPRGWFTATFGAEAADRLVAEYDDTGLAAFPKEAGKVLTRLIKTDGRGRVETRMIERGGDDRATGFQDLAIRAMKRPTPLYALRLMRPDGSKVFSLWSFAYVDGAYRLVGKLKKADPAPMSSDLEMLSELPMADARELLAR